MPWWPWLLLLLAGSAVAAKSDEEDEEDDETPPDGKDTQQPYVPAPGISPLWMLPGTPRRWRESSFGSGRPWKSPNPESCHKGIDIRSQLNAPVVAPNDGTLIGDTGWDGPNTRGVIMQSDGGPVLVFGGVAPGSYPDAFPHRVKRGQQIARIGRYPGGSTMLHFELYRVGTNKRVSWPWDEPRPESLVNPHRYLLATVTS